MEGRGGENCPENEQPRLTMLQVNAQSTHKDASKEGHMEFQRMCICKKLLTTRECGCSLLVTLLKCIQLLIMHSLRM